jgi:hypothetical protein
MTPVEVTGKYLYGRVQKKKRIHLQKRKLKQWKRKYNYVIK